MSRFVRLLFQLTLFLLPSNLAYHWYIEAAYLNGVLIDYLIPRIYLSDLPLIAFILILLTQDIKKNQFRITSHHLPFILFIAYLFLTSLFAPRPVPALFLYFKLCEFSLFGFYLFRYWITLRQDLVKPLLFAMLFQSTLGLYQYFNQNSFIGYIFFGEPNLSNQLALAKTSVSGVLKILPYGTTPHPNVLAGFFVISTLIVFTQTKYFPKKIGFLITTLIIICLSIVNIWLTSSQTSIIIGLSAMLLVVNLHSFSHSHKNHRFRLASFSTLFSLMLFSYLVYHSIIRIDNDSIDRRYRLFKTYLAVFNEHPLFGTGLNQSIILASEKSLITTPIPFYQPVHNIFLLLIIETGLIGTGLIFLNFFQHHHYWSKRLFKPNLVPLITLLLIGLFDHYPITLQTGQLLFVITLILSTRYPTP